MASVIHHALSLNSANQCALIDLDTTATQHLHSACAHERLRHACIHMSDRMSVVFRYSVDYHNSKIRINPGAEIQNTLMHENFPTNL